MLSVDWVALQSVLSAEEMVVMLVRGGGGKETDVTPSKDPIQMLKVIKCSIVV